MNYELKAALSIVLGLVKYWPRMRQAFSADMFARRVHGTRPCLH